MIAKRPSARYPNYESLIHDLEEVQRRGTFTVRSRRRPGALYTTALGIALGLAAAGLMMQNWFRLIEGEPSDEPPPPLVEVRREEPLPLPNGGFETGTLEVENGQQRLSGWRVVAAGPLAETPAELTSLSLDQDAPHEGIAALRLEVATPIVATPEENHASPWGLACRVDDVERFEGRDVDLHFWLRGTGTSPQIIVRLAEYPARDTPLPPYSFSPNETWTHHTVSFSVEPDSADEHALEVHFFLAGEPGDTFHLDDVSLIVRK
jgi:hypothetical protein